MCTFPESFGILSNTRSALGSYWKQRKMRTRRLLWDGPQAWAVLAPGIRTGPTDPAGRASDVTCTPGKAVEESPRSPVTAGPCLGRAGQAHELGEEVQATDTGHPVSRVTLSSKNKTVFITRGIQFRDGGQPV